MKKLLNYRPVLFAAVNVFLGIGAAYLFCSGETAYGCITAAVAAAFDVFLFVIFRKFISLKANISFAVAFAVIFSLGALMFTVRLNDYRAADLGDHEMLITGKVEEVYETDSSKVLTIGNVQIDSRAGERLKYKIRIYIYGETEADIGDIITYYGTISDLTGVYENKFDAYSVRAGVKYFSSDYSGSVTVVGKEPDAFQCVNLYIRENLRMGLGKSAFPTAYAMLTGHSEYMDAEILESYRAAGVAHIFAVSGLHIGFIARALGYAFDKFKANRLLKAIIISLFLFFYSGVCGFTPSSLRASIMCTVMLFSGIKGNRYDGISSLSLAAIIILLLFPVEMFTAGFILSFAAAAGILLLANRVSRLFRFLPQKISSALGTSVAAYLATLPVMLTSFGYASLAAVAVNLVFVPLAGFVFIGLMVGMLAAFLFSSPALPLFPFDLILSGLNYILDVIDGDALIAGGVALGIFSAAYYAALIVPSGFFNLTRTVKCITAAILALICVAGVTFNTLSVNGKTTVYACGTQTACVTLVSEKGENLLVVSDASRGFSVSRIKRIAAAAGNKLDAVMVLGGFECDLQTLVTGLRFAFDVERVYYTGERDETVETVIEKSMNTRVKWLREDEALPLGGFYCAYSLNGLVADITTDGKRITVFSAFEAGNEDYRGLTGEIDLMITVSNAENVYAMYKPGELISYRCAHGFADAEREGNFIRLF